MCRKLVFAATAIVWMLPLASGWAASPAPTPAPAQSSAITSQSGSVAASTSVKASPAERAVGDRQDSLARAAFWGRQVQIDPHDAEAGVKLANALRAIGQYDQAANTAQAVILLQPDNVEALLEFARARIASGNGFYAIDSLRQAQLAAPKDWRPASLLGVAYEQDERPDDALTAYQHALDLSPSNPAVLSNLAMFHATHGDAAQAEALLRQAVAQPGATVQIRQNLALVLGIEGKLTEAEHLVREDLPPDVANNNIAYLHAVASGQAKPAVQPASVPALRGG